MDDIPVDRATGQLPVSPHLPGRRYQVLPPAAEGLGPKRNRRLGATEARGGGATKAGGGGDGGGRRRSDGGGRRRSDGGGRRGGDGGGRRRSDGGGRRGGGDGVTSTATDEMTGDRAIETETRTIRGNARAEVLEAIQTRPIDRREGTILTADTTGTRLRMPE